MEHAIPPLNEIVGLPAASAAAEIARASEQRFRNVLGRASAGDPDARRDLLCLRVAYLNWAYVKAEARHASMPPRA